MGMGMTMGTEMIMATATTKEMATGMTTGTISLRGCYGY
jgi:hypothetical protein